MRPAFVLAIALRLAAAADVSVTSYFPPDTKAAVGIRLRALADAGLFQGLEAEIGQTASSLLEKSPLAGFDPLKDLDEVIIATNGVGEKPQAMVVLRGRFQIDPLAGGAARYHDIPIVESPQHPEGILALIDASTAIAGEAEQVRAAIDRRGQEVSGGAAWLSRVEALRSRCGIWGLGEGLENAGASPGQPGDLRSIDRFEFGVAFDRGLRLAAEIHVRTPQDAEKLTSTLRLLEAVMKGPKKSPKGPGFDLRVDQSTLKFSLILPESEMKQAVAEERGSLMAALSSGLPTLLNARPKAPVRPAAAPPATAPPVPPVAPEGKIASNAEGDTVILTLPGGPPVKH